MPSGSAPLLTAATIDTGAGLVTVYGDSGFTPGYLEPARWTVQYGNARWSVTAAQAYSYGVVLSVTPGPPLPVPDLVGYTATPPGNVLSAAGLAYAADPAIPLSGGPPPP